MTRWLRLPCKECGWFVTKVDGVPLPHICVKTVKRADTGHSVTHIPRPRRPLWAALLALLVLTVTAFAAYEYHGLADGHPGGTVSEDIHAAIPAPLIWLGITAIGGLLWALGWHFTRGRGTSWPWRRRRATRRDE